MCPLGWQRSVGLKKLSGICGREIQQSHGSTGSSQPQPLHPQCSQGLYPFSQSRVSATSLQSEIILNFKAQWVVSICITGLRSEPRPLWMICLKDSLLFPLSFKAASGLLIAILHPEAVKCIMKTKLSAWVKQSLRTVFQTRDSNILRVCSHKHMPSDGLRLEDLEAWRVIPNYSLDLSNVAVDGLIIYINV